jgi:hypothetical protein
MAINDGYQHSRGVRVARHRYRDTPNGGCVSSSEVVLVGNRRYMIAGRASGGHNAEKETTEATKAANAYCAKHSKQMVILQNLDKTGNTAVFGDNINLTFTCEDN